MENQIYTLDELQKEKKKLKLQMEVTKRSFVHSLGYTQTQAKDLLLTKVALPAGAAGLAIFAAQKLLGNGQKHDISQAGDNNKKNFLMGLLPLVLPLVRTYINTSEKKFDLPDFLHNMLFPSK